MLFGSSNFLQKKKSVSSHSLYPKTLVSQEIGTIVRGNLQDLNILKRWQSYVPPGLQSPKCASWAQPAARHQQPVRTEMPFQNGH